MSILESWRLPDIPVPQILTSLKELKASLSDQNSSYQKLMLGVRESYTSRRVMKMESIKFESEARVITGKPTAVKKLGKKLSTITSTSTASIGSSGAREVLKVKDER